jgi:hypothetical protein
VRRIHLGSQGAGTLYDIHDRILAQSDIAADQPLGQPYLVKSELSFVRWPVPKLPAKPIAAELAKLGYLNVNGRPYSAKLVRSMFEGLAR